MQGHNQINPLTAADLFVEITATEAEIISGGGESSTGAKSYSVAHESILDNFKNLPNSLGKTTSLREMGNFLGEAGKSTGNVFKKIFSW